MLSRMPSRERTRNPGEAGFTLVELVIVVVILAILAAIVVPQVMGSRRDAGEAGLRSTLSVVRAAVERYAAQHGAKYPAAMADGLGNGAGSEEAFKNQLLLCSDAKGNCSKTQAPGFVCGPYVRKEFPAVPCGDQVGKSTVKVVDTAEPLCADGSAKVGWIYSYKTGEIICNDVSVDGQGKKLSEY